MFRFTIRDVLWLTVVVGLSVALWVDRTKHQADLEALDELQRHDGMLWEAVRREGYTTVSEHNRVSLTPYPPNPPLAKPPAQQPAKSN
jgi:hypothetical protein